MLTFHLIAGVEQRLFLENTYIDRGLKNVKSQVCVLLKMKLSKGFTKPMKYSILVLFQALESFDDH